LSALRTACRDGVRPFLFQPYAGCRELPAQGLSENVGQRGADRDHPFIP
jgi:hypothetical protein